MKKILLASVATLATLTAFSAVAADLPSRKAPVVVSPPPMWTGFYAGLNAGYNFGTNANTYSENLGGNWIDTRSGATLFPGVGALATGASASNTQSGFIGGGQIGYNYQYGSNIVLGVEADIQGSGIRGSSNGRGAAAAAGPSQSFTFGDMKVTTSTNTSAVGETTVQSGVDWLGTVRGRIGYLWTPTLLVYGTGGLAYGSAYANVSQTAFERPTGTLSIGSFSTSMGANEVWLGGGRQNKILTGWTAGGGAEWMFMPNWSLKAEALYWDLGRQNVQTELNTLPHDDGRLNVGWGRTSVSHQGIIARAGVNYHFNWGAAPVVAAY